MKLKTTTIVGGAVVAFVSFTAVGLFAQQSNFGLGNTTNLSYNTNTRLEK